MISGAIQNLELLQIIKVLTIQPTTNSFRCSIFREERFINQGLEHNPKVHHFHSTTQPQKAWTFHSQS